MKFKFVQSEADGLFQKANRKHQILLNFELKRIAVEQKMRERYFDFEKSLVVAHRNKIIARQKALGIYRPQTTPEKKRAAQANGLFITNVAMETKAPKRLPPVRDIQRKTNHRELQDTSKVKFSARNSGSNKSSANIGRASLPNVTPSWSLTEVPERDGSFQNIIRESCRNNDGVSKMEQSDNRILADVHRSQSSPQEANCQNNGSDNQTNPSEETERDIKDKSERAEGEVSSEPKTASVEPSNVSEANPSKNSEAQNNSSNFINESEKQCHTDSASQILSNESQKRSLSTVNLTGTQRPKSVESKSVEGVRTDLMNMSLRAQSAGSSGT